MIQKVGIVAALLVVLSLPFIVRLSAGRDGFGGGSGGEGVRKLVVVTPHVEQIRDEFGAGFARWHKRVYGEAAAVDWRTPGGTSDIMKQLEATAQAAVRDGRLGADGVLAPGTAGFDLFFGGGSFEHGKMKEEKSGIVAADGRKVKYRLGRPAGFEQSRLDEWFGENRIGAQTLYDPDQYWIGTALSGFGIVYNRDVLTQLGLPEPRGFKDLTDVRYANMLALADGRQSGSITTTYDSILNKYGWEEGWRILREMAANARYFTAAATRVPVDVGAGEAAAGLSIDFYGRGQAQFLLKDGQDPAEGRVGYVDPEGAVYIDADPASILNGARDFELARRFIEYCLSDEAQALWQFRTAENAARHAACCALMEPKLPDDYPRDADGRPFGPERYELRRMPVRRSMYVEHASKMVDGTDPFEAASDVKSRGWRSAIPPLMAGFGIDTAGEARAAWRALNRARDASAAGRLSPGVVAEMEAAFYAMPMHTMRDGTVLGLSEANFRAIRDDTGRWRDPEHGKRSLIAYTTFFREQYEKVSRLAAEHGL
jgi:hypothetical protein